MRYPRMVRVRQRFDRTRIDNIPAAVRQTLGKVDWKQRIRPGQSVALTAGSRGIANIPIILHSTVQFLRDLGAAPFIVPAMGSHGGATAEGQLELLASYGVTEAAVGAPIRSSMETVSLGSTPEGYPLFLDKHAFEADHIGVVGRIKPHTSFQGAIESGLFKMMMIGLGKHRGALYYHRLLLDLPFDKVVRAVGKAVRERAHIAFGLGIVENAYDETALVEAVLPPDFEKREEALLVQARAWMPKLPVRQGDVLVIDQIGKEISGAGMDTNVIGRKLTAKYSPEGEEPAYRIIYVRGLSEHTLGNATGIGMADFTSTRLVQNLNYKATCINCLTAGRPEGAKLPVHFDTDREVLHAALVILGMREPHEARILHIRDTLHLATLEISEPCLEAADRQTEFETEGAPYECRFDAAGNLAPAPQ